ncbi:MAG: hypothetical protein ACRBBK_11615 [Paracoccaceae bacterium]
MQELLRSFGQSQLFIISLASVGLAICIVIDQAQLIAKYSGVLKERVAGGYNAAMKIMVLNRFGAALYFMLISISIDLGMTADVIALFFCGAIAVIIIFDFFTSFLLMKQNRCSIKIMFDPNMAYKPVAMAMIAALFGILGLTFPMLLSSANPVLRLTMANTGFILNSVFTILTVFFVESHIAQLIDDTDKRHRLAHFVIAVFVMRFVAAIIALLLMLAVFYHTEKLNLSMLFQNE